MEVQRCAACSLNSLERDCALLVVDVQNDFADKRGALYVTDGEQVVPLANRLRRLFQTVVFTKDWHPRKHISFASSHPGKRPFEQVEVSDNSIEKRVLWPDHCVQNTWGAELHSDLVVDKDRDIIFEKGTTVDRDSYSAFRDETGTETGLRHILDTLGIKRVFICGLAYDYCVGLTALDAIAIGFDVLLVENATKAITIDGFKCMRQKLLQNGVRLVHFEQSQQAFFESISKEDNL
ncbi:similar to pyrazinamidase/nicotinamidase [Cyanidioschyzon merolae strain 10D]|jgi:nicotinamidase/pyrazinamidase|uniref:nicotinamidase n=1 Tax=Cyanidioschyzon merolae (strain NIES-3377 / 10D) TaxID=280699 RepID=M1V6X0_CYAM1|nr:similar to pyrazinamidase/nicotinamidase [Cyanidioschyzon merolae strain 10D]BAM82585.1 similar to pyrazinamidase/nicotinamidase [Cyanidioschyzon merolae strain 10D]|eukprot:XP_005538621.1 similar to pyrazinamidase/nicotinamidase [Cyanidioschyzon merolae strain 10D]